MTEEGFLRSFSRDPLLITPNKEFELILKGVRVVSRAILTDDFI
jgi:hypothetical protein